MANSYTIKIKNEDKWQEYTEFYIYQAPPKSKATLYSAIYQDIQIEAMSSGELTLIADIYAVTGTTKVDLSEFGDLILVENLDARLVRVTKRPVKGSVVKIDVDEETNEPFFDDSMLSTTTMDASFRISTTEYVVSPPGGKLVKAF
ncbi:hypothetical protein ABW20_dc0102104 [Dactylellina cionopaga]|nr:hypothetical protein ABW20_dc0102104 [Dactylellina cionopaga]